MHILHAVAAELAAAFGKHVPISFTPHIVPGRDGYDLQCNDSFRAAKVACVPPAEIATKVCKDLSHSSLFSAVEPSGRGFINMKLSDCFIANQVSPFLTEGAVIPDIGHGRKTVIDFGGPNICKPLHVGHLRSFVIGESLRRILKATGHDVIADIHLGDWGLQIGMLLMESRQRWPEAAEPDVDVETLEGLYRSASAKCKEDLAALEEARRLTRDLQNGDPCLTATWKHFKKVSLAAVREEYGRLGARFDLLLGESDTNASIPGMIDSLMSSGVAYESEGAVVVDVGGDGIPPLILRKSDGAAIYGSTDLAALKTRTEELRATLLVYCVDQRQEMHLKGVFEAARKAGFDHGARLIHAGFGTVNGKDGKPFKTREGNAARLSDLIEAAVSKARERLGAEGMHSGSADDVARKIGIGALKFADLSSDRMSGYVFDPDRLVTFEGKTGPYVQYACTRISSVERKAREVGIVPCSPVSPAHPLERQLLLECAMFPVAVTEAAERLQPKEIADCVFAVAQSFGRFYAECPVLGDQENGPRRLAIALVAGQVMRQGLDLLGIEVPDRM